MVMIWLTRRLDASQEAEFCFALRGALAPGLNKALRLEVVSQELRTMSA